MSISAVRQYFQTAMDELGYLEWKDGFNFEDVPENIVNKLYHITTGTVVGNSQNQTALDITYPVLLQVYFHGYRYPVDAIDESLTSGQEILCRLVNPANANGEVIKDVQFISMEPLPKDAATNDNIVLLQMNFEVRLFLQF